MNKNIVKSVVTLGACALALTACESQSKTAAITPNTTDDQKFAYMLGAQFGKQNLGVIPRQIGENFDEDALVQGVYDNVKANRDTSAKLQLSDDSLQAIGGYYSKIARERMELTRPDSATAASFFGDQGKYVAYVDSVSKTLPIAPAPAVKKASVTIKADAEPIQKFSYMFGAQFANQFVAIGSQFETEFDADYFVLGIREAGAKVRDTTFVMSLPEDSLKAVGDRYNEKMKNLREEAIKKQKEAEEKLKAEVAVLKGDTLANGMPAKMNFTVKATGITLKTEDLSSFSGKPLLVSYFSATCGHCAHAAPQIVEIAKEFVPQGLVALSVFSGGNNKTGIRKFMDNAKYDDNVSVVWDESRQFGELYSDGYVPKIYLVNPDGTYKLYGSFEAEKETLKKEIAELLKGKNVEWKPEAPAAAEEAPAAPATAPAAPAAK